MMVMINVMVMISRMVMIHSMALLLYPFTLSVHGSMGTTSHGFSQLSSTHSSSLSNLCFASLF